MFEMVALSFVLPQCSSALLVYRARDRNIQLLPMMIIA